MKLMLIYFEIFFIAFLGTIILTPISKILAYRFGAVDNPGPRKIHAQPTPRLGGLAIFFSFWLALFFVLFFNRLPISQSIYVIFLGSFFLLLLGIFDDIFSFSAWFKLGVQILIGLFICQFGIRVEFINNPFNGLIILGFLAIPITIIWIFAIANAINYADGLDGLAAGITLIAACALFFVAIKLNRFEPAILTLALIGCCLGFLKYNFYPASVFMGDSGSTFLGFMLAVLSVVGVLKSTIVIALAIPILALGLPIFDIAFVTLRRFRKGQHIFQADKTHLHHRLLDAGLSPLKTLFVLYFVCFILSFGAVVLSFVEGFLSFVVIFGITIIAAVFIVYSLRVPSLGGRGLRGGGTNV